jgi:cell wall-associated NlpC family hydrolase
VAGAVGAPGSGVVPGAVGVVSSGAAPVGLQGLLAAPGLSVTAPVKAWLASGQADPRVVSVLDSVLAHHSIGVSGVVSESTPVHVQSLEIVSVDGQPVGPDNFAARDLVTEIAALDPSVRPDEIGTPWPIQSPGFFSDPGSQGSLHLAFEMPGTNAGVSEQAAGAAPGAASVGSAASYGVPGAASTVPGAANSAVPGAAPNYAVPGSVPGATTVPGSVPGAASSASAPGTVPGAAPGAGVASTPAPSGGVVDSVAASGGGGSAPANPNFASPTAHNAFEAAKKELGVPYVYGGESEGHGFDCSGLMQWSYHQAGINLPRVAADQFKVGSPVGLNDLKEGDLVFFRIGGGEVDHVGMYVGNHQFIEAPRTGENVMYADLRTPYWSSQFAGARRVVPLSLPGGSGGAGGALQSAATAPPTGSPGAGAPVTGTPVTATPGAGTPVTAPAGAPAPVPTTAPAAGVTPDTASAGSGVTPQTSVPAAPATGTPAAPGTPAPGVPATPAAPGAVPPGAGSGTAQFQAVASHERPSKLHTVKFMQAVQPAPGSPLAAAAQQPAGTAPPGQPVSESLQPGAQPGVQPAVQGVQPGVPGQVPQTGVGEQLLSQAPAVAPGSIVSVSSPMLTSGQQTFVAHLASATGLNPRVVAGWVLAEESGSAAQGRQAASNYNWLNIGYFDSGTGAIAHASPFSDPVSAAEQTAKFLKGQWGGASSGIQDILHTVGKPPDDQIMSIANSGWASSHYNNGANLRATFEELSDMKIVMAAPSPGGALT